jgi:hypothetical protein
MSMTIELLTMGKITVETASSIAGLAVTPNMEIVQSMWEVSQSFSLQIQRMGCVGNNSQLLARTTGTRLAVLNTASGEYLRGG